MNENKFGLAFLEEYFDKYRLPLRKLWLKRKKIIWTNVVIVIATLALVLFYFRPYYDSTIMILPDYGNKTDIASGLGGLASLAALSGLGEATLPLIYESISTSETVLNNVIYKKYKTEKFADSVNLIQYYEIEATVAETKESVEREKFVRMVKYFNSSILDMDDDRLSQILSIRIRTPEPRLSMEIANTLVSELDKYVREQRKSYASEQRFYIEKRIDQVKDSLSAAEDSLKNFQQSNRTIDQSPELILEQARQERNVEILQSVYLELSQQLELVKIEEIKDVPILNVLENAQDPVMKKGPRRFLIFLIIVFFTGMISLVYYFYEEDILEIFKFFRNKVTEIIKT
ncbi:MAG: hypothetical protein WBW71_11630 [Bacteroidota bacterium]